VHVVVAFVTEVRLVIQTVPLCLLLATGVADASFTVSFYWVYFDASCYLVDQLRSFEVIDHVVVAKH